MPKVILSDFFPLAERAVATAAACALADGTNTSGRFSFVIKGARIVAPYRVYDSCDKAGWKRLPALLRQDEPSRSLLLCFYSRHHDGFLREECVRHLLENPADLALWALPYILKAAEEYVAPLSQRVYEALPQIPEARLAAFLTENPRWLARMQGRCASYWDYYHRWTYPRLEAYPGIKAVRFLRQAENAARQQSSLSSFKR